MSKLFYRGVEYNPQKTREEYVSWYSKTHAPSSPRNSYRGVSYRPCNNWNWEEKPDT